MGVAQNQHELDHVLHIARHINGVQKVVNYVTLKEIPLYFEKDGSFKSPLQNSAYQPKASPPQPDLSSGEIQRTAPAQRAQPHQQPTGLSRPNHSSAFD